MIPQIYRFYSYKIYPRIKGFRGATRFSSFLEKLAYSTLEKYDGEPESIFEAGEWDNLIILDACRYDLYEKIVDREVEKRVSLGSMTKEFIEKTFSESNFDDIVYVTANPHLHSSEFEELTGRTPDEVFHTVFPTYEKWNDEEGTVIPESVVKDARTAAKLFPDKKLIIHFMQPHEPFIGNDFTERESFGIMSEKEKYNSWQKLELGLLDHEEVMGAYRDNLEYVLPHAEDLVQELRGKTVVTSDHGNLTGEKGFYGHPKGWPSKGLREVPWHIFEQDS